MSINTTHSGGPGDRRWFRLLLIRILAEQGVSQYRIATRASLEKTTLNRLVNGRRYPTEAQALKTGIGVVCSDDELKGLQTLLDARWNNEAGPALTALIAWSGMTIADLTKATSIGEHIIAAFLAGTLVPTEAESLRLFIASVVRDARLMLINTLLEAARYHTIGGPVVDSTV